jgi:hypothetical protein
MTTAWVSSGGTVRPKGRAEGPTVHLWDEHLRYENDGDYGSLGLSKSESTSRIICRYEASNREEVSFVGSDVILPCDAGL